MRNLLNHWTSKSALIVGVLAAASAVAPAQAIVAAQRGAEIAPFVSTTMLSPDWGGKNDYGYTLGVDYTRFIRSIVQPSIEARFTSATGPVVNEHSFTGGLKLQATIHRVHPYATLLVGQGDIIFVHPVGNYLSDNSIVYSLGAGAEFPIARSLRARVDFTHQTWNLDPNGLTPVTYSIGVAYSLPFNRGPAER